ncbi:DNA replication protein DnaC [Paenibacillus shirakamiensis]|uniref:DNA replication protein DnaC n=1 Tax=Paenibacillus shirakamiensis TaxID=1265935 RepID=A0ABS4JDF0_9BACL|nr:ATP-binding protein [Paenibacillus shirakamiensis]MBP1999729.1 DNA replication protein DnaC [Paenibacillus shirakamiensis]
MAVNLLKPEDMIAALPESITNLLYSDNPPWTHWGCCIHCRKFLSYNEYTILGRTRKFKIHCDCEIEHDRQQKIIEERRKKTLEVQKVFSRLNLIPDSLLNAGFKNFQTRPGSEKCYDIAKDFYRNFENEQMGYVFFGTPGNGKSHLSRAVQRSLDADGYPTLFLDWPKISDLARKAIKDEKINIGAIVKAAIDVDLLVLDDIGTGHLTDYEFKTVAFPIINGRQGKKTLFTSNLSPDRLEEWFARDKDNRPLDVDGRCIDRIIGSCKFVLNKATSYRRERARIIE